ncbi:MAG: hypothetical protein ABH830_05130 [Patescibacteria group bacterium]
MIKYSRILVLVTPIIIWLFLLFILVWPKIFYFSIIFNTFLIFLSVWLFIKNSQDKKDWWNFSLLPVLFHISIAFYATLLNQRIIVHLLYILVFIFTYFYFRNIYAFLVKPDTYKPRTLENISSYGNFLVIFFSFATIYGLQSFLNSPVWLLMLISIFFISLVVYNVIWANKIDYKIGLIFILICTLILVEIGWSLSFLPLNYNVLGLIIAICYYMLIGLVRFYLNNNLVKNILKVYLSLGIITIIIILFTASWM